ncbi:MAG TPA: DUF4397 domain-containing protein [Terriglobales bacterium]|nr:DUF4397 domain-containing protein [Terriglobales bacterium]
MRRRTWGLLCIGFGSLVLASFTVGCGSSSSNGQIRLVNATPDEIGLDLLVDTKNTASGVGYGAASAYSSISSGARNLQVEPTGGTNVLIDTTPTIGGGNTLTLVTLNFSFNISSVLLTDDNSAPTSGDFKLRILNASPGIGSQDVYLVPFGTDIGSVDPTFSNVGLGSAASYSMLTAGDYEVFFTTPGQKFINLDSGKLTFAAGQVRTLIALNNPSGAFMSSLLTDAN